MNRLLLENQMAASLDSVTQMRKSLSTALDSTVPLESMRQKILLLFAEAATNLVQHADRPPQQINLKLGKSSSCWWLEVRDDGSPWDPGAQPSEHKFDAFEPVEDGRGLALLHSLSDKLLFSVDQQPLANCLRLEWLIPDGKTRSRVLLVDDDKSQCRLLAAYLSDTFETIAVYDGGQAIERLRSGDIDLVISDINMPRMDGWYLREAMSQRPADLLTPFIFLTGLSGEHLQQRANSMGIDDYLVKPIDKVKLLNSIERVLERSNQLRHNFFNQLESPITNSLAPKLPDTTHHWRLALEHRNTGSGGGDFLLYQQANSQTRLVVVDVMGHNHTAKFFSHAYAGYLRGLLNSAETATPQVLLQKLSSAAGEDELLQQATLTACVIDLQPQGQITVACAGHPPPLIVSPTGIKALKVGGVLPGLLPNARYQPLSLRLNPDERLAVFTDGLFESPATADDRQRLEDQIKNVLTATAQRPIHESIGEAMQRFDEVSGNPPTDDTLLLLIEPTDL